MNKIIIYILLSLISILPFRMQAQNQRVIRDVVLLDRQPYEVLMSENGDILSRIKYLPDYLTSRENVRKQVTNSTQVFAAKTNKETKIKETVNPEKESVPPIAFERPTTKIKQPGPKEFKDYYEIEFLPETATLTAKAITTLNDLAFTLNASPDVKVQVFGFQNESPLIAMLLSKRRRDACIAYLKIKGVRVDRQITKGSITKGSNNKIVFGIE